MWMGLVTENNVMTKPQHNYNELARRIAKLIQKRDPALLPEAIRQEAIAYVHFLIGHTVSWEHTIQNSPPSNPYDELKALQASVQHSIHLYENLSSDANLSIMVGSSLFYIPDDPVKFQAMLYDLDYILEKSLIGLKSKGKGKPKQDEKRFFVEAVIQIFERSKGFLFDNIGGLSEQEQRKFKTEFYKLLDVSILDTNLSHSITAFRKFSDRVFLEGRQDRESVQESLADHMQDVFKG